MNDSQTAKKTVMLTGRVPPELKKRFRSAAKKRGWNVQTALERVVTQWVMSEEEPMGMTGHISNPPPPGVRGLGARLKQAPRNRP